MSAKLRATITRMLLASMPHTAASREEPAPKLLPGHQDAGIAELRLVEHEIRILAAVVALRARMNSSVL